MQFLTEEAFARGAKILITGFSHGLAKNKAEGGDTPESPVTTGYAQEDGSLHLRVEMPGRLTEHATFERGTWRELSKAEYAKLSSGALEKMQSLHGGTDEITHELANTMMKIADKMTARANLWKGKLHEFTQAITVFSKEPTALEFIKKNVPANFGVSQIVETWLQGDDAFLVLSTGRTQSEVWAMTATDIDDLVSKVLPEIAVDLVRDMSSTVLIPAALSDNDRARTLQQWQALGGRAP